MNKINIAIKKFGKISLSIEDKEYIFNMNTSSGIDKIEEFIDTLTEIKIWHYMWNEAFSFFDALIKFANDDDLASIKDYFKYYDMSFSYVMFFDKYEFTDEIPDVATLLKSEYESVYGSKHTIEFEEDEPLVITKIRTKNKKEAKNFILLFEKNHYKNFKKMILSTTAG